MTDKKDINNDSEIDELLSNSLSFEDEVLKTLKEKIFFYKNTTLLFGLFSFILVISIVVMLPLKKTEPYLIRVDNNTGYTDIVPSLANIDDFTTDDVLDRHMISNYVDIRERYYADLLQNDYEVVQIYNSKPVNSAYLAIYEDEKKSPDKIYKSDFTITPEILSISISRTKDSEGNQINNALVRLQLTKKNIETKEKTYKRVLITIGYEYDTQLKLNSQEEVKNPLKFKVTAYKIDNELGNEK